MFDKILIANRGEIALRVERACKELGVATVAVHSTADADAMHVRLADESVCIGAPPAKDSYLNIPAIVAACEITGADAVHPGYGFLAENARFAEILEEHDITFIGPSAEHVRLMGDKIQAKVAARVLGIPVVPGSGPVNSLDEARSFAREIGYPVLVKAAAGGGGRGMKLALEESQLEPALAAARNEARAAFGDPTVYLEKYLVHPRTSKCRSWQTARATPSISASATARCSVAIRSSGRKLPSPRSTTANGTRIGEIVANAMHELNYRGVGTVEFLYEGGEFYFIEMNTRLQVEHTITEMITGLDLVIEQIRIAAGAPLSLRQEDVRFDGHAIECRINAENPHTFRPSPGTITHFHPPGGLGVRVDSGAYAGYTIPPYYDSLIGKLIVHARTRNECLMRLKRALGEFVVDGIETTIPLFNALIAEPDIVDGNYDIHWLETYLSRLGNR
jgi:acetyl-CoA carboxylase biotin carboxylase subunit